MISLVNRLTRFTPRKQYPLVYLMLFLSTILHAHDRIAERHWNEEIIAVAATLPIQDQGRIKPLETCARFKLLRFNGRSYCRTAEKTKINAMEWLLNCLFFPDETTLYPQFLIENDAVLNAIKISIPGKKKRDRYSYRELESGRELLFTQAQQYSSIEKKNQTLVQSQIIHLAENLTDYEWLVHYLDFTREAYEIEHYPILYTLFGEGRTYRVSDVLRRAETLIQCYHEFSGSSSPMSSTPSAHSDLVDITEFIDRIDHITSLATSLALFTPAPTSSDATAWLTPAEVARFGFFHPPIDPQHHEFIALLEEMAGVKSHPDQFLSKIKQFHHQITTAAEARGEYEKIPLEVSFYRANLFSYSLMLFIMAFVCIALGWLMPRNRMAALIPLPLVLTATVLLVIGISWRCIIRGRPPVSTLYESILFITAVIVIMTVVMEYINRQRLAISVGAVLGVMGLFLANKYELKESIDTMPSLVAVLDSNFWLATHVTTVTIGYAAGLLAGAIAHLYIIGMVMGWDRRGNVCRELTRMVYGTICFGLFFSVIGTILGGIWANDSWGRFWGWDPKENGALMIVLAELALLHARMGGYIRDFGINMAAIAIGCLVTFSWWGVNLLGVGLHSYGWTSGAFSVLAFFYIFEITILGVGIITKWQEWRSAKKQLITGNDTSVVN